MPLNHFQGNTFFTFALTLHTKSVRKYPSRNYPPRTEEKLADLKGLKRICMSCGARFYDLNQKPIICPSCSVEFTGEIKVKARRGRLAAVEEEEVAEEEEIAEVAEVAAEDDETEEIEQDAETVSLEDLEDEDDDDAAEDEDDLELDDDLDDLDDDLDDLDEEIEEEEVEEEK